MAHPKLKSLFAPPCILCLLLPLKSLVLSFHPSYCFIKRINSRYTTPSQENTIQNSGKTRQPITSFHNQPVSTPPDVPQGVFGLVQRPRVVGSLGPNQGFFQEKDGISIGKLALCITNCPRCEHPFWGVFWWWPPSTKNFTANPGVEIFIIQTWSWAACLCKLKTPKKTPTNSLHPCRSNKF